MAAWQHLVFCSELKIVSDITFKLKNNSEFCLENIIAIEGINTNGAEVRSIAIDITESILEHLRPPLAIIFCLQNWRKSLEYLLSIK